MICVSSVVDRSPTPPPPDHHFPPRLFSLSHSPGFLFLVLSFFFRPMIWVVLGREGGGAARLCEERKGEEGEENKKAHQLTLTIGTGACLLYGISRVVIGENKNYLGGEAYLRSRGVEVVVLEDAECKALMDKFIAEKPDLWCVDAPFPLLLPLPLSAYLGTEVTSEYSVAHLRSQE